MDRLSVGTRVRPRFLNLTPVTPLWSNKQASAQALFLLESDAFLKKNVGLLLVEQGDMIVQCLRQGLTNHGRLRNTVLDQGTSKK